MSFFLKKSSQLNGSGKQLSADKRRKRKFEKVSKKNEEITSSEDEDLVEKPEEESSDDENETAQEKKLRLAKLYLKEIEREEKLRLENEEVSQATVAKRLRDDHLKEIGRYEVKIADEYKSADIDNIKILKCKEQNNTVTCLCVSSDDQWIFSGSKNGVIVKWSLAGGKKVGIIPFIKVNVDRILGHCSCISSIAISMDYRFLVVGDASGNIEVWNPDTLVHIQTLKGHRKPVTGLCFKQNSHTLYSTSADKSVRVWSLDEMAFVENLFGHQDSITSIDVLRSDRPISAGGRDGTIRLWKVSEESQLVFNTHPGNVDTVKMCNEQYFVSGGVDGSVSVWSCLKKKPLFSINAAHGCNPSNSLPYWITTVTALPHTDLIASGSQDGYVRLWKLGDKFREISPLFQIPVTGFVNCLSFTSDGKFLIVGCGRDHRLGRWDVIKNAKNCILVIPLMKGET